MELPDLATDIRVLNKKRHQVNMLGTCLTGQLRSPFSLTLIRMGQYNAAPASRARGQCSHQRNDINGITHNQKLPKSKIKKVVRCMCQTETTTFCIPNS
jgi:hypothetical protein